MIRRTLRLAFLPILLATTATPCGFHGYAPTPSMLERLLASDHIILARAAPDNPFRFAAVEALEGSVEHVEIPFLVDSVTRRKLGVAQQDAVLFARDGAYGPWQRLAYVDVAMRPVVDQIMERLPEWELGGDAERYAYFAGLMNHPSSAVHDLALRELDQADYAQLKAAVTSVDVGRIVAPLNQVTEAQLRPIRLLLLGLSGDPEVLPVLEGGLEAFVGSEGAMLGAYATAFLELGGPDAVRRMAGTLLVEPDLAPASAELLVEALALNAISGSEEMQQVVHAAVADVLSDHPGLAPAVARQFGIRNDWAFAAELAKIQQDHNVVSAVDAILLSQYIQLASQADQPVLTD